MDELDTQLTAWEVNTERSLLGKDATVIKAMNRVVDTARRLVGAWKEWESFKEVASLEVQARMAGFEERTFKMMPPMYSSMRKDITLKGLETLCNNYHTDRIDALTFQKEAAKFVVRWAAFEMAAKAEVPIEEIDPDILVDVVVRPQVQWKPSVDVNLQNTRWKWAIVLRSYGKTKNLFGHVNQIDIESVIGTFETEKEARDWLDSMEEEFKRRGHPEGKYSTQVKQFFSPEQIEHAYE